MFKLVALSFFFVCFNAITAKEIEAIRGRPLKLVCYDGSYHSGTWYKGGQKLISDRRRRIKKVGKILKIRKARKEDAGMYKCVGENFEDVSFKVKIVSAIDSEKQSAGIRASGAVKPNELRFTERHYPLIDRRVFENADITFDCEASGGPLIRYKWYKNGNLLQGKNQRRAKLTLRRVYSWDAGEYKCVVSDGNSQIGRRIRLYVIERPRTPPYLKHLTNKTKEVGESIKISCIDLIGGRTTKFYWIRSKGLIENSLLYKLVKENGYKSGANLTFLDEKLVEISNTTQPTRKASVEPSHTATLNLISLTTSDQGFYTCLATNILGSDIRTMFLSVA